MATYTVDVQDDDPLTVNAEYYKREDGWTTFKDAEHKVVHDIPSHLIRGIATSTAGSTPL